MQQPLSPPPGPASSAPAARPGPPSCPECAEPLDPEDRFCGHCGRDVTARAPQSAPRAAPRPPAAPAAPAAEPARAGDVEAYPLAPPAGPGPAGGPDQPDEPQHGDETLPLGLSVPVSDPRAPYAAASGPAGGAGPVCVACGLGGVDADGYCEHCGHAQPRQRDHQEEESAGAAAVSDRGLRHHRNEDAFALTALALPDGSPAVATVVCDGVSTAHRPDDASAAAAEAGSARLRAALERGTDHGEAMRSALMAAFDAVTALADEDPPGAPGRYNAPACTCVSAIVSGPVFTVGWIGDSRAYWIPDDRDAPPARLTEDDSWAARMVSAGLMSEAEAYADERAHAITGWLGADAVEVDPHVAAFRPDGTGVVVVCTDGLWNYAESAADMAEAIPADARERPLAAARALLGTALDGGGHDNVTVAVLPFPISTNTAPRAGFPSAEPGRPAGADEQRR